MFNRARGGRIQPTSSGDNVRAVLSPGLAVVPDELLRRMSPADIAKMNGGETVVLSASEALQALDED